MRFSMKHKEEAKIIEDQTDYFRVVPLLKNVNAQIIKCDVPPKIPDNEALKVTMKLCQSYFKFLRTKAIHKKSENTYDLSTSAGLPFCKDKKLNSKKKVLEFDRERLQLYIADLRYKDIGSYNDKDELLSTEELSRNKTRGVFGSTFHGIYREKLLYGRQNKIILEKGSNLNEEFWIRYGFVKQYGGLSKFARHLQLKKFRWESDCSGFDRRIFLFLVYLIRNANIINDEEYAELIKCVTEDNVTPLVLLPNGYLVRRPTGNSSGKNNTTVDNSIAHFIINIYIFVKRMLELGYDSSEIKISDIFDKVKMGIYSDDKLGSFNLEDFEFSSPEEFLEFERICYDEFGLEIKKTAQFYSLAEEGERLNKGHSFLGSNFDYDEQVNMYVPRPRFGKVCSSFTQKYKNKNILIRFARILSLTINCFPDEVIFQSALKYLVWYYNQNLDHAYQFDELLDEIDLDLSVKSSFQRIFLGFESKTSLNGPFRFV